MKHLETSIADIELEIEDRQWTHLPTEEIVDGLVFDALEVWRKDQAQIKELLWNEKLDDKMAEQRTKENTFVCGDYITAVHLWARGAKKW